MPSFSPSFLRDVVTRIFEAAGAPSSHAALVAESLVDADLAGHGSHGVIRVTEYLDHIGERRIVPGAVPRVAAETETTAAIDGEWAFGQVAAGFGTEVAIRKAKEWNVAAVTMSRCGHVGRLSAYTEAMAEQGLIGFAFVNAGGKESRVAPFGGARPVYGTNPLSMAMPSGDMGPIAVDFSTATIAAGKIRVLKNKGENLPEGAIVDREGRPSTNPNDYYSGGMLLPAAGHKGSGLAFMVEALGGILSGAGSPSLPGSGYKVGNGVFILAVNTDAFAPRNVFAEGMSELTQAVKAIPPAEGFAEVLLPGEPERRARERAGRDGLDIPDATWSSIKERAEALKVPLQPP